MTLPVFARTAPATSGRRRLVLSLAATAGALALPSPVRADPVRVQFVTSVRQGQTPKIRLRANEEIETVTVELDGEGGKRVLANTGPLRPGAEREIELPGDPGRRHFEGKITVVQKSGTATVPVKIDTVVAATLEVTIDRAKVDTAGRQLEARLSRPPAKVEIALYDAIAGAPHSRTEQDLRGRDANEPFIVVWPSGGREAARIDLRFHDVDGFYTGVSLFPWSVHIPHEEVVFATDAAAIAPSEAPKLEASHRKIAEALRRHAQLGPVKLFIAGHTDTVGADAYNFKLSQRRAQAIAAWFRKRGLSLPILFEGFGEHAPLVGTPDNTDEPRNRRVDYILAIEEPRLPATRFRASWKALP